jgi:phosphoethanolamine N-methyltransferase
MLAAMDLIWGEGFMAPGGAGNLAQLVDGLCLDAARVLDLGCGQGMLSCLLAQDYGAEVVGTDLESHLVARARERAAAAGLENRLRFVTVAPGPMEFASDSFDAIVCSGAMTQVEDKLSMYLECLRVLRRGGTLSCYDWMKPPGDLSATMHYWFELEGLTYALRTPSEHLALLKEAGFSQVAQRDKSAWYRNEARREYGQLTGKLRPRLLELLGKEEAEQFVESWRVLAELCAGGELLQVYTRACKAPA